MRGIRMSMSTTSGASSSARATASAPSTASPTTVMSGSASRIIRRPVRTSSSSSASRTRIMRASPPAGSGRGPRSRRRSWGRFEGAAVQRDPLAHAHESVGAAVVAVDRLHAVGRSLVGHLDVEPVRFVAQSHVNRGPVRHASGRWSWPPARSCIRSVRPQRAAPGRRPRRGGRPAFPSPSSRATRSGISCRVGCGTVPASAPPSVSRPSRRRISAMPLRPAVSMEESASRAWSGEVSSARCAPCAWITITPMLCATRSCSSRAIRARSSATALAACSCLLRSASSARSVNATAARAHGGASIGRIPRRRTG